MSTHDREIRVLHERLHHVRSAMVFLRFRDLDYTPTYDRLRTEALDLEARIAEIALRDVEAGA